MEKYDENIFARGLSFFGRTNRLISHEMKNVLAIISETTSLLDELVELSEEGKRLEPGKLHSLTHSILEDIDRANEIIRNMNTFAHGVDSFFADADVGFTIKVMINISRMNAAARKAQLDFPEPAPLVIFTIPFVLQNLLYETLNGILSGADTAAQIRISLETEQNGACIRIKGTDYEFARLFIKDKAVFYKKNIGANFHFEPDTQEMLIRLPDRIEEPDKLE